MSESFVPMVTEEVACARLVVTILFPDLTGEARRDAVQSLARRMTDQRCEHPDIFANDSVTPVYCPSCDREIPAADL